MKKTLPLLLLASLTFSQKKASAQWAQTGQNINGVSANDNFGFSLSMSADGQTVASAAPYSSNPGSGVGHVQVYKNIGGVWTQEGQDLIGVNQGDNYGFAISLNDDGSVLAISAPNHDVPLTNAGIVQIFENIGGNWTQVGDNIVGSSAGDKSGKSVSISGDGLSVAIGAVAHGPSGTGQVRVYKNTGGTWTQQGSDVDGIGNQDALGTSVNLSNDGLTFITGLRSSMNGTANFIGSAKVYEFNGTDWVQKGLTIEGEAANDNAGASVDISSDGTIVAVGANNNDGAGSNAGHVRVFEYLGGAWSQIGQDIDGEAADDQSGISLSLNGNGSMIVIGAKGNSGGGSVAGQARVYENIGGTWTQKGIDIDGVASDQSGWSVDISSDGLSVIVGGPYNDEAEVNAGQAKVYSFPSSVGIETLDNTLAVKIYPNPVQSQLTISTDNEIESVSIIDLTGKTIRTISNSANVIDVSDLQTGIYFVQIKSNNKLITKKIIKE
jgi:hypothetical protein